MIHLKYLRLILNTSVFVLYNRAYERGFRGYIVPGPGLRGPGRVKAVAFSFGARIFFLPAQFAFLTLGKGRPFLFFFAALNLILGKNWDQIRVKTFFVSFVLLFT